MTMSRKTTAERKKASRNVDESMDKLYRANRRTMDELARK
jgi:hypothetical protein